MNIKATSWSCGLMLMISSCFSDAPLNSSMVNLSVSVNGAGLVTSTPSGLRCSSTTPCVTAFPRGTNVTLTAEASASDTFSSWNGACSGSAPTCQVKLEQAATLGATFTPRAANLGAPRALYTDILAGPNSGGENGKGAYLSVFGMNFGSSLANLRVLIGGVEVDNYRYLGVSRGRSDIQQVTVQIGALGNPTPGIALPITVVVNGIASNADLSFTVNPGRMLFVDNVAGNDATAVVGEISKPFRFAQRPDLSQGAWGKVQPGDFIVLRATSKNWMDVGFENYFLRYRDKSGSAPTGASGTGPITIMGYPTEDVLIRGTLASGMTSGCLSGINGQSFPGKGQWAIITNLRIDCEGYDGPISQQIAGDHWRVVNNDLSASSAATSGSSVPRMAGITGNGQDSVWLGNRIHDIQGSPQECHGIYIDGDGSYEIAFNLIENIRSGNGFQVFVNGGNGSDVADDIHFHHNLIRDVSKHGINLSDGTRNNVRIYNNIVYNTKVAGVRFNTVDLNNAKIFNNTFYNTVSDGNTNYAALMNDWNLPSEAFEIRNNIFVAHSGTRYEGGSVGIDSTRGPISHNLWFGGIGAYDFDANPRMGDPKFVNPGLDFRLQTGSPALDTGSSLVLALVQDDFDIVSGARPKGSGFDIGAFER
jgi:hypothetical protein